MKRIKLYVSGRAVMAAVWLLALMPLAGCRRAPEPEELAARYASELRSADRLVLASMTVRKMATVRDTPLSEARDLREAAGALLDKVKIGSRVAAYSFTARLEASVDLSTLSASDFRFSPDGREVTVTLPPVVTEFAGRDLGMREEHYRVTGMRSAVDARERARLKDEMTESLREDIRRNPAYKAILQEKARAQAGAFFSNLFAAQGIKAEVEFR